ncbi:hypothetical protein ACFY1V_31735 [Streptomyces sp. NPDC001255]|uniref:hypothetical protein n=1 Tax=Streptomyces sp. NPDC001255 TaxID=3364550 RepID=UPI0036948ABF
MRDLLLWPLHSTRRLALTALVLLAAGTAAAVLLAAGGEPARPAAPPSPGAAPPAPPRPSASPSPTPSPTPEAEGVVGLAVRFVTAWADRTGSLDHWYRTMLVQGDVTPDFARALLTVDRERIPASRVTGPGTLTDTSGLEVGTTQVAVPTDAGPVSVRLGTDSRDVWHVRGIEPGAQARQ